MADATKIPAAKPPPGVKPNFKNPQRIGIHVYEVQIILPVIAGLFVALRLYSRHFIVGHALGLDDALAVLALVPAPEPLHSWFTLRPSMGG